MEWLQIIVIAVLIVILGLYFIVKRAVKDALKEYFENKISEKRKEYFRYRKGKWQKVCFIASIILALTFVTIGLCQIIQRKMIGILLVCAGIEIGLSIAVDLGTAERK